MLALSTINGGLYCSVAIVYVVHGIVRHVNEDSVLCVGPSNVRCDWLSSFSQARRIKKSLWPKQKNTDNIKKEKNTVTEKEIGPLDV